MGTGLIKEEPSVPPRDCEARASCFLVAFSFLPALLCFLVEEWMSTELLVLTQLLAFPRDICLWKLSLSWKSIEEAESATVVPLVTVDGC